MRVIETSVEEDLAAFSRFLWQHRLAHRIFEERGRQVLELAQAQHADQVRAAYEAWRSGQLQIEEPLAGSDQPPAGAHRPSQVGVRLQRAWQGIRRYPALTLLVAAAVLVYPFSSPVADGRLTELAGLLTIIDIRAPVAQDLHWTAVFGTESWWRLLTPVLLHFSVVHLLFNCAITVEFGRRVEARRGSFGLLALVALIGVASNLGQFWVSGNPLFGGLSGVAYGVLGYLLVSARRFPTEIEWQMPKGLALSLLLFLVVFSTGITESFGLYVANTAHWTGLACGAALGAIWPAGRALR